MQTSTDLWMFRKQFTYQLALSTFMTYSLCVGHRSPHKLIFSKNTGSVTATEIQPSNFFLSFFLLSLTFFLKKKKRKKENFSFVGYLCVPWFFSFLFNFIFFYLPYPSSSNKPNFNKKKKNPSNEPRRNPWFNGSSSNPTVSQSAALPHSSRSRRTLCQLSHDCGSGPDWTWASDAGVFLSFHAWWAYLLACCSENTSCSDLCSFLLLFFFFFFFFFRNQRGRAFGDDDNEKHPNNE